MYGEKKRTEKEKKVCGTAAACSTAATRRTDNPEEVVYICTQKDNKAIKKARSFFLVFLVIMIFRILKKKSNVVCDGKYL